MHSRTGRTGRFSYQEQRRLTQLAAEAKSPEEISKLMGRSIEAVRILASQLGIRLESNGLLSRGDVKTAEAKKTTI
jgi:hypothetical protein